MWLVELWLPDGSWMGYVGRPGMMEPVQARDDARRFASPGDAACCANGIDWRYLANVIPLAGRPSTRKFFGCCPAETPASANGPVHVGEAH